MGVLCFSLQTWSQPQRDGPPATCADRRGGLKGGSARFALLGPHLSLETPMSQVSMQLSFSLEPRGPGGASSPAYHCAKGSPCLPPPTSSSRGRFPVVDRGACL